MIEKIKAYFQRRRYEKFYANIDNWVHVNVITLDPKGKGVVIFKYGMPDYMVSGKVAEKLKIYLTPIFEKNFPNYTFIFIPFFISVSNVIQEGVEKTE